MRQMYRVREGRQGRFDRQKFGKFFTPDELAQGACLACQTRSSRTRCWSRRPP